MPNTSAIQSLNNDTDKCKIEILDNQKTVDTNGIPYTTQMETEIVGTDTQSKEVPKLNKKILPLKSRILPCPYCKLIMHDDVTWKAHLIEVHSEQVPANFTKVSNKKQLKIVKEMKENKDKYIKDEIAYRNKLQKLLISDPKSSSIKCSICSYIFSRNFKAMSHVEVAHLNIKQYPCRFCSKIFGDESTYCAHKLRFHMEDMKQEKLQQTTAVIATVDILE